MKLTYIKTQNLFADTSTIIETAKRAAYHSVNVVLVQRNWLLGKRIVEEQLGNQTREELYGQNIITNLAQQLTAEYGGGYDRSSLYKYVRFYQCFPNILDAASPQSFLLTWTHYRILLQVEDKTAREWYANEVAKETWSTKTLQRNISSQYYYRMLEAPAPEKIASLMLTHTLKLKIQDIMKQFTFSAVMANNLLTVLQGCSKTIRLLLVMLLTLTASTAWGADGDIAYTLSCVKNTSNSAYATYYDVTINSKKWTAPGNQTLGAYWRIGGKSLSNTIRNITGKNTIDKPIKKITISHNGKSNNNLTVNSFSVTVATDANFSNIIETKTITSPSVSSAGSFDLTPTNSVWESGCYYKFSIVLTNSKSSNYGLDLTSIVFYEGSVAPDCIAPTITTQPSAATYTKGATATALKVVASGDDLTYQWYSNTSNNTSGATKINGATNSTYTPSTSTVGTKYYYCIVSSGSCSTTSNIVSVVVKNPPFTVTLNAGSGTCAASVTEASAGEGVTLPTPTLDCGDWEFAGWKTTSAVTTETTTKPTLIPAGAYSPTSDITLYAVYKRTEGGGGGSTEVTFNFGYTDWGKAASFSGTTYNTVQQNDNGVSVTYTRNDGSLYANSTSLRLYKTNTLTFDAGSNTITSITFTGSIGQSDITTDAETCTNTTNTLSWAGSSKSVTFTRPSNASSYATLTSATLTIGGGSTTYYHSTPDCATTPTPTKLATPTDLQVSNITSTSATLSWTGDANASSYTVFITDLDDEEITLTDITETSVNVTGLSPETLYLWDVVAVGDDINYTDSEHSSQSDPNAEFSTIIASTYTVTWMVNGEELKSGVGGDTFTTNITGGNSILDLPNEPDAPAGCSDKVFVGWTTEPIDPIDPETVTPPSELYDVLGDFPPVTENVIYYAVWADEIPGSGVSNIEDNLTNTLTGVSGSSYTTWYNKNGSSGTVYAGNSAENNGAIQLRSGTSTNSTVHSGIITTTSVGKATKIKVEWNNSTSSERTLDVYGKNDSKYQSVEDLYDAEKRGTKIGSIVFGTSTTLEVTGDYSYIGLRSASGAMYLNSIQITWATGTPTTYSAYTTSCTSAEPHTVNFNAGSGTCDDESLTEISGGAGVTLPTANPPAACATDGWEFAGWWTGPVAETTTSPGELLTAGSNYKPTIDCTLYAVYSYTEAGGGDPDVTFNFSNIATANSWTNGTAYTTVTISPITINAIGGGNNGKYYTSNTSWRMYNGGSLQISTDIGKITSVSSNPSKTFTINDEGTATLSFSETTEFKSITVSYSSTTTTYNSNPTCLEPVWKTNAATIDKTSFTVNCGERSPMTGANGAAIISFPTKDIYNFTKDITIEATTGFLVSTSQSVDANYQSSVSLSPLVGTVNANTFNDKHVYVRAEAPAQSDTDLEGTITIKNNKGETLQTFSVTADVTCNKCTVQFVDRGANYQEPILRYSGETINEAPADPEGVCTDPIHYVFDGWATASVAAGATTYTKVTFPYTVEGDTKFYAVYRYVEDGGADSGDYVKVTSDLDDYSGDYLFVYETGNVAFDGGLDELDETSNTIAVTINANTIASNATTDAAKFTIAKVDGGYSIKSASGYYIGRSATSNGLSTNETYSANYDLNTITNYKTIKGKGGYILKYNKASDQKRFRYYQSGQEDIALYRKAASYLYTTSPICSPHLAITEGKEIYVTGGNAGGTRDLVIAQQKVSYKATRLNVGPTSQVPDVKVATNGITVGGVVTSDVKVTIDQTKEQQTDGTYTITGTITVQYQPSANNKQEDIQVQLAVDYNAEARDNFTVHARSLPAEFVIVAKSGDKWYALNGDMNTNAANPANGQVTLDDDANPTQATYAPCNTIYTFDGVPNTGDRTYVRFQGIDGAWLWASSGTNVGIQNNVLKTTPEGNNNAYNWKLYTENNITYRFGNANSSRQLTLSGEKFGMYASGVQDIRILPYVEKCLYNYAPSNLKVSVLKGTYVTLTWDAVVGATKYQYSTDATNWTDAGTDPTVTINGLEPTMMYTIYIRAYHEDAGVTRECIDYTEISFATANCDDVPSNITYTADLNSITVSWTAAAPTATITYNTKEDGTGGGGTINNATSPCRISGGLDPNTTYYIQILAGGDCASPIIPVKTKDVEVDIVEWKTDGIVVDVNTNEKISVSLENEVSFGSGIGTEATELFFSKYYEASYNVKLVAIYNGTKNIIDLTDYTIQYGKTSWESNYITLKDFGATKGQIQPGEEIILYSYTEKDADDKKILDCVHDAYPDGNWVRVTSSNNEGKGTLSFGGDKTIILCKTEYDDEAEEYYDNIIDVIGALKNDPNEGILPTNAATEEPSWGDKEGWVCETGLSIADDSQIGISTNRCLLIRNNTVTSGDNAVTQNIDDFVTLCSEWKGAHVPDNDIDNGVQASCDNFAYVGTFDYSDYYTKYVSMGDDQVFEENKRNPDGTVTISIPELSKQSCRNIRIIIKDNNTKVISNQEYKVPIMITSTQGTDGQAFLDLQQNLATVEVDGSGNPTGNKTNLTLEQVREICKTCDVVVRDNAILTKKADDAENDHPQVRNVYVYENSSLIVPNGTNYTINNLSLRRKGDEVSSLSAYPDALKLPESVATPISLDLRVDANNWHWFTLPYNCNIADVTWIDGSAAQYNVDWFLMTYDGEQRANTQSGGCWKQYNGTTIEAGKGYIVGITGDLTNPNYTFELRFPMAKEVLGNEGTDKTVDVRAWGVETNIRPNHKGWNLVGNPYLAYYQRDNITNFEGLRLGELIGPDSQGYWEQTGDVPYVVVPVEGGWVSYEQQLASETDLMPFTAYFVQVGNDGDHDSDDELSISFDHTKLQLSATPMPASIVRRAPAEIEEIEEPIIVGVSLTNSKGESDKTSLVIDDKYTDEYEMNADFFKWFGDYYRYYTKPVVYTIGADKQQRAFNAINEEQAAKPVSMGTYTAQNGEYTFSLDRRSDLTRVKEVWLHDATESAYINLMQEDYSFSTGKTDGTGRFTLSVTLHPKSPTDITDGMNGQVYVTSQQRMLYVNNLPQQARVWVYDAVGKLLVNESTNVYQRSYHVGQAGVYFVRVESQNGCETLQVAVE